MRHLIDNMISLSPQNVATEILVLCIGIWIAIWVTSLIDALTSHQYILVKILWALIISIPGFGTALYALYSLAKADWSAPFFWRKSLKAKN
jgi:hypothetical protein